MYEKEKKTPILSGDFRFRVSAENKMSKFNFVSFSAVNGISFSSAFSFRPTAENEKNSFRSASSMHHKKVLVLKKSVYYITDKVK